jgi:2-dehydropantoate 2-reductase
MGACLAEVGNEVTLVARPAHAESIERDGLLVSGLRGDRVVRDRLRAVSSPDLIEGEFDCLLLAVKTRDTDRALASAESIRNRFGVVLSVQNAVDKDARLAEWAGAERVVGSATTESATMVGPGRVRHLGTAPTALYLSESSRPHTPSAEQLAQAFSAAGIAAGIASDITQVQWEKLLQITIVSAFSASTLGFHPTASFAHGISTRAGAEHYVTIALELLGVYLALGYEPQDFFAPYSRFRALRAGTWEEAVEDTIEYGRSLLSTGVVGRPSLHEDIRAGRASEVDDQLGAYVEAADRLGIDVPTARGCLRVIRVLEALAASDREGLSDGGGDGRGDAGGDES